MGVHFILQGVDEQIVERDGVGGMRHAVGRTDRANAGIEPCRGRALPGNSACVTMASIIVAPAAVNALAQAIMVPPEETISSTIKAGRPGNSMASPGNAISTERSPRRVFCATVCESPKPAGEIADPRLAIPHPGRHDGCRDQDRFCVASPLSPAWPTDCRIRSLETPLRCQACDADAHRR